MNCPYCSAKVFTARFADGREITLDRLHRPDGPWAILNGDCVPATKALPGSKRYRKHSCPKGELGGES